MYAACDFFRAGAAAHGGGAAPSAQAPRDDDKRRGHQRADWRRGGRLAGAAAVVLAPLVFVPLGAHAQERPAGAPPAAARSPLDSISRLPGAAAERDTTPLLAPVRLAALPRAQRAAWERYIRRSRELDARGRVLMAEELRAVGKRSMTAAPYVRYFTLERHMTGPWFASDSARRLAANILTWQTPAGGWSKHVDMRQRGRQPGESFYGESDEWHYIGTFDNDATVTQLRIVGGVAAAWKTRSPESESESESGRAREPGPARETRPDSDSGAVRLDSDSDSGRPVPGRAAFIGSFRRGLRYLFDAQYPNGCFPQVYPLQGGYHDAVTFNDNVTVNLLRLLRDVAEGRYPFVAAGERRAARLAFDRGLACVLRSQVVVNGVRTVWGQQHDPLTLLPAPARSYELAGLSGRESAWILDFLMELPQPSPAVVAAVNAGAAWFRAHAIRGYAYGEDQVLRPQAGAGPIWARNTEIRTMRPIFANRDGIKLYDWHRLTDRRAGYGWFGVEPAGTLRRYEKWARQLGVQAR